MKARTLKGWDVIRTIWLIMGLGVAVGAWVDHKAILLLPALYFIVGAVSNVGCFAGRCYTNLKDKKASPTEMEEN